MAKTIPISFKMLDMDLPSAMLTPNPHADFVAIHDEQGGEVTITGVDFWQYVGECTKRAKIQNTVEWLEQQPAIHYAPADFRPPDIDY